MSALRAVLLYVILGAYGFDNFPVITRGPGVKKVKLGDSVTFYCETYGDPAPTLYWEANGHRVHANEQVSISYYSGMTILSITGVTAEMDGKYCCNAVRDDVNLITERCGSLKVRRAPVITTPPSNQTIFLGGSTILRCEVSAYPTPNVAWYHNDKWIKCLSPKAQHLCESYSLTSSNSLRISRARLEDGGSYKCGAGNDHGLTFSSVAYLTVQVPREETTTSSHTTAQSVAFTTSMDGYHNHLYNVNLTLSEDLGHDEDYHKSVMDRGSFVLIIGFVIFSIIVAAVVFKLWTKKKKRMERRMTRALTGRKDRDHETKVFHSHPSMKDSLSDLYYPIHKLQVVEELGEGVFGLVFKANAPDLVRPGHVTTVAVKTVRVNDRQDLSRVEDFGREAELLATFHHDNIIQLLGVCADDESPISQGSISCLLFEYVDGGDLCAYLRTNGPDRALFQTADELKRNNSRLEIRDLDKLRICTHIAKGMMYLSERNFIHRDLATRNCLISEREGNVKIADFGLSRRTYESDYYKATDTESVPIRWMSPESILYGKYSSQSDVWAYGVTLWEVYTFAIQPYFSLSNEEVICSVCEGKILPRPPDAPTWMYNLMQLCWHRSPEDRPTFATIHSVLEAIQNNEGNLPLTEQMVPSHEHEIPIAEVLPLSYGRGHSISPNPSDLGNYDLTGSNRASNVMLGGGSLPPHHSREMRNIDVTSLRTVGRHSIYPHPTELSNYDVTGSSRSSYASNTTWGGGSDRESVV